MFDHCLECVQQYQNFQLLVGLAMLLALYYLIMLITKYFPRLFRYGGGSDFNDLILEGIQFCRKKILPDFVPKWFADVVDGIFIIISPILTPLLIVWCIVAISVAIGTSVKEAIFE